LQEKLERKEGKSVVLLVKQVFDMPNNCSSNHTLLKLRENFILSNGWCLLIGFNLGKVVYA
jgi:hypothetical protein